MSHRYASSLHLQPCTARCKKLLESLSRPRRPEACARTSPPGPALLPLWSRPFRVVPPLPVAPPHLADLHLPLVPSLPRLRPSCGPALPVVLHPWLRPAPRPRPADARRPAASRIVEAGGHPCPGAPPISERPVGRPRRSPRPLARAAVSQSPRWRGPGGGSCRGAAGALRSAAVCLLFRGRRRRGRRPWAAGATGQPVRLAAPPLRVQVQLQGAAPGAERRERALLGPRGQ